MPIRFAILGAGRIGQVHARAVAGNDDAVLAAVFDPAAGGCSPPSRCNTAPRCEVSRRLRPR